MPLAVAEQCALAVVDVQPKFMEPIAQRERVLRTCEFLVRAARLLDVPILATEQYPTRMGGTDPRLVELMGVQPAAKMSFSCAGCEAFDAELDRLGRSQVVLIGIETHICVSQTAHDLMSQGRTVLVAADAVSSRTLDRHGIGLARLARAGATLAHSESIVYEWMRSADHPRFREVLEVVKQFA